jgi:hypothetical protein
MTGRGAPSCVQPMLVALLGSLVLALVPSVSGIDVSPVNGSRARPPTSFRPTTFRFASRHTTYAVSTMDSSDQTVDVFYPVLDPESKDHRPLFFEGGRQFPLISYAHGFEGGGDLNIFVYFPLLFELASYGTWTAPSGVSPTFHQCSCMSGWPLTPLSAVECR